MKKLLFLVALLAASLFFMAACNRDNDDNGYDPGPGTAATTAPVANVPDATMAPIDSPDAPAGDQVRGNYVVVRATILPDNNIAWANWGNPAVNGQMRDLIWGGRGTLVANMYDELFANPSVMVGGQMPTRTVLDNGDVRFHFHIYTTNVFSDGTPITAEHYAGNIAFLISPQWNAATPGGNTAFMDISGRLAWLEGEANVLTGVRLYDDANFSVTIRAEGFPMIWEDAAFASYAPFPLFAFGVEAHDDGEGVFLTGPGGVTLTNEMLNIAVHGGEISYRVDQRGLYDENDEPLMEEAYDADGEPLYRAINDEDGEPTGEYERVMVRVTEDWVRDDLPPVGGDGFRFAPTVFVGPYVFHSVDTGAGHLQVQRNPRFGYTWDNFSPRIEYIIWREVPDPTLVDALAAGEVHMTVGQGQGQIINNALDMLVAGGTHNFTNYDRPGYGLIQFHTDTGPTQFTAVRQAFKWLIDRDVFGEMFTEGHGSTAHGPYANSWWWTQEARDAGMYDRLIMYTLNVPMAISLLEADGWNYTADGEPFVGPGRWSDMHIRHKWVDGELMPLRIDWATFTSPNRITDIINVLLPGPMEEAGFYLNEVRYAAPTALMMRQGEAEGVRYNMFNLGLTFTGAWAPWLTFSPDSIPAGNWGQVDMPHVMEAAYRIRNINDPTGDGRADFIEAFIEFMVVMNYEVTMIPLYVDIWFDFVPYWLGDWNNNALWGFAAAIQRAYVDQYAVR
ncbi:MAG: ABC transporter substrate-binding protein [Defluviitaleaceae bacterium]|nr:ABC transporter substrate-binding protein [Defluviitaleaceae bacterium]